MKIDDNSLRYDKMVESALRGVVRQAVAEVQKKKQYYIVGNMGKRDGEKSHL
jgi:hypothetical protein